MRPYKNMCSISSVQIKNWFLQNEQNFPKIIKLMQANLGIKGVKFSFRFSAGYVLRSKLLRIIFL